MGYIPDPRKKGREWKGRREGEDKKNGGEKGMKGRRVKGEWGGEGPRVGEGEEERETEGGKERKILDPQS
jgi:hypothetical protein